MRLPPVLALLHRMFERAMKRKGEALSAKWTDFDLFQRRIPADCKQASGPNAASGDRPVRACCR
jgi:hypothetical protein